MMLRTISGRARWRRGLLEFLLLVAVLLGVHAYQTRSTVTGVAPPLAGIALDGRPLALEQLRGRLVLVHFWATWCPVCRAEEDNIEALARDWTVLSVAYEDTPPQELRAYIRAAGLSFPVLQDADGALAQRYGVRGVPTSFVVDPAGRIRFTEVGYATTLGLRLRLWLAAKLYIPESPESAP